MPVSNVGVSTVGINDSEVTLNENVPGEYSSIIDIQIPHGYRYEFVPNQPIEMFIPTHESFSVSANSTETKNLANDLVNSPSVRDIETQSAETSITGPRSLVVWDDTNDIQSGVDSVDYSANSFTYTNSDSSADSLEAWYLWGDSAQVEFRQYTPDEERYEKNLIKPMRAFHSAQVHSRDAYITFPEPFSMHEKEHLKIAVKSDVDLTNWDVYDESAESSPGNFTTYGYADFSLPVKKVPMKQ